MNRRDFLGRALAASAAALPALPAAARPAPALDALPDGAGIVRLGDELVVFKDTADVAPGDLVLAVAGSRLVIGTLADNPGADERLYFPEYQPRRRVWLDCDPHTACLSGKGGQLEGRLVGRVLERLG